MPTTFTPAPPFFNDATFTPPRSLPVTLTIQMNLHGTYPRPFRITAAANTTASSRVETTTSIVSYTSMPHSKHISIVRTVRKVYSPSPYPLPKTTSTERARSPSHGFSNASQATATPLTASDTPVPGPKLAPVTRTVKEEPSPNPTLTSAKRAPSPSHSLAPISPTPDADSSSHTCSSTEDASYELAEVSKIPKPLGEPGRPGRGGYNFEIALGWNAASFSKLKKCVHRLADEHLDTTKCVSGQDPACMQRVRDKAQAAFPDLKVYSDCWPVNDLVMMRLKYTSGRARRRRELGMAVQKLMDA